MEKLDDAMRAYFKRVGALGGQARAKKLTEKRRREIASMGGKAYAAKMVAKAAANGGSWRRPRRKPPA